MAGRLLLSVTLLLAGWGVDALPKKGDDFFLGPPVSNFGASNLVPHSYIIMYKNNLTVEAITAHEANVKATVAKRNVGKRSPITGRNLLTGIRTYDMGKWHAIAIEADDTYISKLYLDDEVDIIEQNAYISINAQLTQGSATSGLARISHREPGERGYVFDDSAGEGITVYVVDTGILVSHDQFRGRASFAANFVDDVDTDENGHGSHVAGTIAGRTFGVAKNAELVAVKVLDAEGGGTTAGVLDGMDFVVRNATARNLRGKAVMNMSLGGGRSNALNRAINAIANAGVVPVVAAGNENQDTANTSPGSAELAITVGAIDQATDLRASFSNFGPLVDIFAPGVNVLSVGIADDTDTASLSGTSMASPHVAGLAAYLMALEGISGVIEVSNRIKELAAKTQAEAGNLPQGTTPLIANNGNL